MIGRRLSSKLHVDDYHRRSSEWNVGLTATRQFAVTTIQSTSKLVHRLTGSPRSRQLSAAAERLLVATTHAGNEKHEQNAVGETLSAVADTLQQSYS